MTLDEVLRAVYRKDVGALRRVGAAEVNQTDGDGRTPLMHAVLSEDADPAIVEVLVTVGANVTAADHAGWTALHFAARDQDARLVGLLLDAGAEVDAPDVDGSTPLWRCVMDERTDAAVVALLLDHGADPTRRNRHGSSPLDVVRNGRRVELIERLEAGALPPSSRSSVRPVRQRAEQMD